MNKGADGNSVPVRLTVRLSPKMHRHLQQVELRGSVVSLKSASAEFNFSTPAAPSTYPFKLVGYVNRTN